MKLSHNELTMQPWLKVRAEPTREQQKINKWLKFICRAQFHCKPITQGGLSMQEQLRLQVALQLEMSRDQTCNLSTAASPTTQQVSSSNYYSWSRHTAEKKSHPSSKRWRGVTKIEWENVYVCTSMSRSVHDPCVFWLAQFCFVFLPLPKHVFGICMLEWLNLLLWWTFPKCHAMF